MTAVSPSMIICGLLLIVSAFALVGHPFIMFFDLAAGSWTLWNSISRIDPPSIGPRNLSPQD